MQRRALRAIDGRAVSLQRGISKTDNVVATIGETRSEDINEDQQIVTIRFRDWIINRTDYIIAGRIVEPEVGDHIIYEGEIWAVQPTPSEPGHRRHDRDRTAWRIHTKKVGDI